MAYNPDDDEYLVVYQAYASGNWRIRGRRVSGAGVPPWPTRQGRQGSDVEIGGDGSYANTLPAVAYDPRAGEYLVVWQVTGSGGDNDVHARRLAADGTPVGEAFVVSGAAGSQQQAPTVGYGGQASLAAWQDNASSSWVVYGRQYGALVADFSAAPLSGEAPLAVTFSDLSTPAGTADEWRWAFGTGVTSTLASPVYTYTLPGVYTVTQWVTDTATGETDSLTRSGYITVAGESATVVTTTIVYDYDPLYRLASATYSTGEVYTYTYDSVGNRLKKGMSGVVTEYVYDDGNRLTSAGGVEYTWDGNGNLLDDGVREYTYDHADRLIQVVSGTFTTTFAYNDEGHRVAKAENGVTTNYVVAVLGLSQVLVETTGGETIRYVYGHDLLAEYDGAAWAWHLNDALGSVRQLADESGAVVLAQSYTPFGMPLARQGSGATGYGFTGERWEAYSALLFLRARYYEPATGRFLSRDTLGSDLAIPRSHNSWLYVSANPVNLIDSTGHDPNCKGDLNECARDRMMEIISEATPNRGEALFRLFEDDELFTVWGKVAGEACHERLRWVLKYTKENPNSLMPVWRLDELAGPCGLAEEFLDQQFYAIWYPQERRLSNQVGHFLAAVEITYDHWDVGFLVGHEQVPDGTNLWETARNWFSYLFVSPEDYDHWFSAVMYDEQGDYLKRDEELWAVLHFDSNVPFGDVDRLRLGNSLQDLRLSLKGYRFARWVRENKTRHPSMAGTWLRENLGSPRQYLPTSLKE